jgi:hypothetical protein
MGLTMEVGHVTHAPELAARLKTLGKRAVYVGIPESTQSERTTQILKMALRKPVKSKKARTKKDKLIFNALDTFVGDISNAQLLWIFSKGSPLRSQPPREVLEPSVQAGGNREAIAAELAGAAKAALDGDQAGVTRYLKRAGLAGQNAARSWFTDARNGWAPNAPATIAAKGSDRPGIDTGAMRAAIVAVVDDKS